MNFIMRLFPPDWRARYGEEFLALLDDQPAGRRRWLDIARCLVVAHLDHGAAPSLEPRPLAGRALVVSVLILAVVVAALGALFVGTASQSAVRRAGELVAPLLFILPAALVVALGWSAARQGERSVRAALPAVVVDAFVLSVVGLTLVATLSPQLGYFEQAPWIELRPFVEVLTAETAGARTQAVADVAGNALLFLVLGFALALQRGTRRAAAILALAVLFALVIEVAQAVLGTGRPADSTDVIARVIGAAAGYGLWRVGLAIGQARIRGPATS